MNAPEQIHFSADRTQRLQQVSRYFPQAAGPDLSLHWPGGRQQALARLAASDAAAYARTRNHLDGAVTRLSPYFRHGCLTTREAIDQVQACQQPSSGKLVSELAYRDYFRQVWYHFGDAIFDALEAPKVALGQQPLPDDVSQGCTGLVCMDEIVRSLLQQGYVHNHARMWFAAYLVHWLKVDWRQAAHWFASQLLDGDLASNHLSWQWVASTLSQKPYYFNRDNLRQFAGDGWCRQCRAQCPFDASYEALHTRLFQPVEATPVQPAGTVPLSSHPVAEASAPIRLIWIHDEMLSSAHPLFQAGYPAVFVFDDALYGRWSRKRLQFMADCLAEMPSVQVWRGAVSDVMRRLGAGGVLTQHTPRPDLLRVVDTLSVTWQPEVMLTDQVFTPHQLMRFSRYWKIVESRLRPDATLLPQG